MGALQTSLARSIEPRLIEAEEVGRLYGGVSKRTVWRWADRGLIPKGVRISGKRFWPVSVIEEALASLTERAR